MAIPSYESILRPLLALHADGAEHDRATVRAELADHYHLSPEDWQQTLPSGRERTFNNRVNWAAFYLSKAGLLERPQRGTTRITARGQEVLAKYPDHLDDRVLAQFPEFREFLSRAKGNKAASVQPQPEPAVTEETPEEAIDAAYQELRAALAEELLGRSWRSRRSSSRRWCWTCCWPWATAVRGRTPRNDSAVPATRAWTG